MVQPSRECASLPEENDPMSLNQESTPFEEQNTQYLRQDMQYTPISNSNSTQNYNHSFILLDSLGAASVNAQISASFLSREMQSVDACLMDEDLLRWLVDHCSGSSQDWGINAVKYSHKDFQHQITSNIISPESELV